MTTSPVPTTLSTTLELNDYAGLSLEEQLRQAGQMFQAGQLDQARELCQDLCHAFPDNHEIYRLLGLVHHRLGLLGAAADCFAAAIGLAPESALYHFNYGMVMFEQGRLAEASGPIHTAIRIRPDLIEGYLALGNIEMMSKRPDEAVRHYSTALEYDRRNKAAYYNLAMAYVQLGFWQSAVPAMEKAAAIPPQDGAMYRQLGDLLYAHQLLAEGFRAYLRASNLLPGDITLLEKLGDLSVQLNDPESAGTYYRRVLAFQPQNQKVVNNLGLVLQQQEKYEEAVAFYRQTLATGCEFAELHYNLANGLVNLLHRDQAVAHYREAVRLRPDYVNAWFNLGAVCQKLQRYAEAETAYRQVLCLDPASQDAIFGLALVQQAQQRRDEAIATYGRLIALSPDETRAYYNMGIALNDSGRHDEAADAFKIAHDLEPDNLKVLNNWGLALHDGGRLDQAVAIFRQAIALQPDFAEALANLGNTYLLLDREDEALEVYRQAITYDPTFAKAYYNLGCLYLQRNDPDKAIASYRQAIALDADFVEAHWNLSNALLLKGDLAEGFREYRWRWRRKGAERLILPLPEWQGERRPDATLLIVTEQGKGDTIQFVRYLPWVKSLVGRIVLACEQSILPLMAALPGIDEVISKRQIPEHCAKAQCYAPLLNLPDTLRGAVSGVPTGVPYLHPDRDRIAGFRELFVEYQDRLKVGIVWQGNAMHKNDKNRSCPPHLLEGLVGIPWVAIFSLQKTPSATDSQLPGSIDLSPHMNSFADTAALMLHLDLVISVDTAPLHLAGALGIRTWGLLPFVPDWRWLLNRDDTPWYPTMRLFRQSEARVWPEVIAKVKENLILLRDQYFNRP